MLKLLVSKIQNLQNDKFYSCQIKLVYSIQNEISSFSLLANGTGPSGKRLIPKTGSSYSMVQLSYKVMGHSLLEKRITEE